jgi:hypothetical protein
MTIYVVTSGIYSDYKIDGVFSTREKAESFAAEVRKAGDSAEVNIEDWPVDAKAEQRMRLVYHASILLESGEVFHEHTTGDMLDPNERAVIVPDIQGTNNRYAHGSSAVSAEHAMKLAVEARQNHLRQKALEEQQKLVHDENARRLLAEHEANGGH